ncbi:MAG: gliding motility-associated C-terminal domain-containing protein, partial [Bacteroidota bacterium]
MVRLLFLLSLFFVLPQVGFSTHNRAGEIIVEHDGECGGDGNSNRVCATIITYTEFPSDAFRDSLLLEWGDGSSDIVFLTSSVPVEPGINRNEYKACHTYDGPGQYIVSFTDPNRVGGILNLNPPNSIRVRFSVFTVYTLTDPNIFGCNSTPTLSASPLTRACTGETWSHNPGAFDPDGDSLSFEFTTPRSAPDSLVPNYVLPNEIGGGPPDIRQLTIDPVTGQIIWNTPNVRGEYNLAFYVISWRNGIAIDTTIRDMQIFVEDCSNRPPVIINDVEEICVVAGDFIEFTVEATAPLTPPDDEQLVKLIATGGPFLVDNSPATFVPESDTIFTEDPVTRIFRWQTVCEHISNQPYLVAIRAEDNFFGETGLSTTKTITIRVVAPPPEDLDALPDEDLVTVSWENPYICDTLDGSLDFLGFSVWRREGSNPFEVDTCVTGMAGRGYTQVADRLLEIEDDRYVFFDEDVNRGRTYCYRVLAQFGRRNALGFIFERLESIPSEEICVQLPRDIPLLTQVDVTQTDPTNGQINVCWIRPDVEALDTMINQGPYRYVLSRADGQTDAPAAFSFLEEFVVQEFDEPVDTCFLDQGLNTQDQAYSYRIELFVENEPEPIGEAQPASSVRLAGAPTDEANQLNWTELVPWTNSEYDIFRRDPGGATFDSIDTVTDPSYLDQGLTNGEEYCYFIRSVGSYNVEDIPSPLLN